MWSVDFGTGTTTDDFAAWGNEPVLIDKFKSLVTTGAFAAAVALSMWSEMPSAPLAFVTFSDVRRNRTSSSVQRSCSGQEFGSPSMDWMSTGLGVVESCTLTLNHPYPRGCPVDWSRLKLLPWTTPLYWGRGPVSHSTWPHFNRFWMLYILRSTVSPVVFTVQQNRHFNTVAMLSQLQT